MPGTQRNTYGTPLYIHGWPGEPHADRDSRRITGIQDKGARRGGGARTGVEGTALDAPSAPGSGSGNGNGNGNGNVAETENGSRGEWRRILANQAKDFCLSTGLHGYKYIAQPERSVGERLIWAFGVLVSLGCAVALTRIAWDYNAAHPTLTVIESTHHGIWNYPFPAVTICDLNRVSLARARDLVRSLKTDTYENTTVEELVEEMRLLNELLDPGIIGRNVTANLTRLQSIFDRNNLSIGRVIKRVTRDCSEMIPRCKWKGMAKPCEATFFESLTRDGFCCSFNYLGVLLSDDHTSLGSFPVFATALLTSKDQPSEPRRVTACGYQTGLTVLIDPNPDDYHASLFGAYGVKLIIHDPYDYPDRNAEFKLVGTGVEVFVSVSPEITYSTPGVRDLSIAKRDCVFVDEGSRLDARSTTQRYSYQNCLSSCRLRTILDKCGCVPYYYGYFRRLATAAARNRDDANNETRSARICDLRDNECATFYRQWYDTSWPGSELVSERLPPRITKESLSSTPTPYRKPCDCAFDCTLVRYPLEGSSGPFDRNNSYNELAFFEGIPTRNRSVVHVFFSDLVSTQYRRDVYYTWHNLFASFGGLLGLFAGFSLMSGFELVYFFTVRLIADACTRRRST